MDVVRVHPPLRPNPQKGQDEAVCREVIRVFRARKKGNTHTTRKREGNAGRRCRQRGEYIAQVLKLLRVHKFETIWRSTETLMDDE